MQGRMKRSREPNPTDRAKCGSKRRLICDVHGIPLAIKLTGANCHDSTQALPLLDGIPSLHGPANLPLALPLYCRRARSV